MEPVDTIRLKDVLLLIGRTRVFSGLTQAELRLFGDAVRGLSFDVGTELLGEGAPQDGLNIVLSGSVEVCLPADKDSANAKRPNRVALATLKTGDCFGEYAIFDDKPASASVVGFRAGRLVYIKNESFRTLLGEHDTVAKKIYYNLLQIMVERLRASARDFDVLLSATG